MLRHLFLAFPAATPLITLRRPVMSGVMFRNSVILEATAPMIRHLFIYFPPSCSNNRHIGLSEAHQLFSTQGIAHSDRITSMLTASL
jgi:hypothetical protein